MFIDAQQQFSDAQALSATAVSTNIIDLGSARQIGVGEPMCVFVQVDVSADAVSGDETYAVQIQTDDNSSFSSPATIVIQDMPRALFLAGTIHYVQIPLERVERYLRLNYALGGTTPSVTLTSGLQPQNMIQATQRYPIGQTIS